MILAAAAAWMTFISYQSSQPNPFESLPGVALDKGPVQGELLSNLAHLFSFGLLAVLLRWGLGRVVGKPWAFGVAFALTALFAIGDEVHQRFTPGRASSAADVGVDVAGAVAALGLSWLLEVAISTSVRALSQHRPADPDALQ